MFPDMRSPDMRTPILKKSYCCYSINSELLCAYTKSPFFECTQKTTS